MLLAIMNNVAFGAKKVDYKYFKNGEALSDINL